MLRSRNGIETTNLIFIGNVSGFYKKGKPPMVFTWQRAGGQVKTMGGKSAPVRPADAVIR
jgi:hypothetical protein